MFFGLAAGIRYGATGKGSKLKFAKRRAGPRYCEHSLAVSGPVVFSIAPMAPQMNSTGLEKLLSTNWPTALPVSGL